MRKRDITGFYIMTPEGLYMSQSDVFLPDESSRKLAGKHTNGLQDWQVKPKTMSAIHNETDDFVDEDGAEIGDEIEDEEDEDEDILEEEA